MSRTKAWGGRREEGRDLSSFSREESKRMKEKKEEKKTQNLLLEQGMISEKKNSANSRNKSKPVLT